MAGRAVPIDGEAPVTVIVVVVRDYGRHYLGECQLPAGLDVRHHCPKVGITSLLRAESNESDRLSTESKVTLLTGVGECGEWIFRDFKVERFFCGLPACVDIELVVKLDCGEKDFETGPCGNTFVHSGGVEAAQYPLNDLSRLIKFYRLIDEWDDTGLGGQREHIFEAGTDGQRRYT